MVIGDLHGRPIDPYFQQCMRRALIYGMFTYYLFNNH